LVIRPTIVTLIPLYIATALGLIFKPGALDLFLNGVVEEVNSAMMGVAVKTIPLSIKTVPLDIVLGSL
tara:strand:+ start:1476 stop:1679 length:204 start_codon:yes stop_codon:yes gene_type:complete